MVEFAEKKRRGGGRDRACGYPKAKNAL